MACTCNDPVPDPKQNLIEIYAPTEAGKPTTRLWWGRNTCLEHKMFTDITPKASDETPAD